MANSAADTERHLSNSKEQLLSGLSLSDAENDDDPKWKRSNQRFTGSDEAMATTAQDAKEVRSSDSPMLSSSEPDVRTIRYSREILLILRDSELSKRKPEQHGRAWMRISISNDDRDSRGDSNDGPASNYSSTNSLSNNSSSSYLLPSFACKRRPPGSAQSGTTEIKRNTAVTPKKDDPATNSTSGNRRSVSSIRNGVEYGNERDEDSRSSERGMYMRRNKFGENNSSNDYRMANENRRIGSGRIPLRDSWDDPQYNKGGASNDYPSNKNQTNEDGSPSASTSSIPSALGNSSNNNSTTNNGNNNNKSEQNKTNTERACDTSSTDFNLRPGGGLLGLRDRQRENEQQTSQSSIAQQSHPHISRVALNITSILEKAGFRSERFAANVPGDDRYDRRPFNRDRGDRDRDRNDRDRDRTDRDRDRNDRDRDRDRNDRDRNDRDRNDRDRGDRDGDRYGRYNDDMPRGGRYNNNDRNSYSYSNFNSNDNRRRHYNDRNAEEPEWFSGGPTSQNDTIELRGFDSEFRRSSPVSRKTDSDKKASKENNDGGRKGFFDNEFDDTMVKEINDRCKKYNDTNNNDKPESGSKNDDENDKDNDVDGERVENADAGKASKNDDNFNFEEFLKAENITDLLSGAESFKDTGSSESRFSRWFATAANVLDENNPSQLPPQKSPDENNVENGGKTSLAQFMLNEGLKPSTDPNVVPDELRGNPGTQAHAFLEFLQRSKLMNLQKIPTHAMRTSQMVENNNQQDFQQSQPPPFNQSVANNQGPLSVEELEARLRQAGPVKPTVAAAAAPPPTNLPSNETGAKNVTQDAIAFKKLLQQMSNDQQQQQQQQQQPPPPLGGMFGVMGPGGMSIPMQPRPLTPITRKVIMEGPEATSLIRRMKEGKLTPEMLMQQVPNPNLSQRDREAIAAVLFYFTPYEFHKFLGPPRNNPPLPVPNVAMPPPPPPPQQQQQQQPQPNQIPTSNNQQPQNNSALTPDMLHHLYLQAAMSGQQKQQLRVSPLPNGVTQRIPSPRELQFHTQSIMQNALIKKKLEEQRENFRKRQEMQQQQGQMPQMPNPQRNPNFLQMHSNQPPPPPQQPNQIPTSNNQQSQNVVPEHSMNLSANFWQNIKEMNNAGPTMGQPQQKHPNQHTSSPTPTLAFTPTSVLRKMTAEKETDNSANNNSNSNQKPVWRNSVAQPSMPPMQNQFMSIQNSQQMMSQQQQKGRPIVKGNGIANQFPANEFQQQQFLLGAHNQPPPPPPQQPQQHQQPFNRMEQLHNIDQQRQQQLQQLHRQQQFHQQFHQMMQQHQMMAMHNEVQQQLPPPPPQPQQRSEGDGHLSPTSNQLARWFSPELLAQASAGKLPSLNAAQTLSLEDFERNIHSSTTVNN